MKREYHGLLSLHDSGEACGILYLSSLEAPIAEELDWMSGKLVTVRYWITDKQCTKEEAIKASLLTVMGIADVDFRAHYSEMTGYLWTDEELKVGGHDLLDEFKSHVGQWLFLEVEEI